MKQPNLSLLLYFMAIISLAFTLIIISPQTAQEQPLQPVLEEAHSHARLGIIINGQPILIPANIGSEGPLHTHDWDGIIHIHSSESRLGSFFDIWGVSFSGECIFQYCNQNMTMYVNGKESSEFDSYQMKDGDEIFIIVWTTIGMNASNSSKQSLPTRLVSSGLTPAWIWRPCPPSQRR